MDRVAAETPFPGEEPAPLQGIAGEQDGQALVAGDGLTDSRPRHDAGEKDESDQDPSPHEAPPWVGGVDGVSSTRGRNLADRAKKRAPTA